MLLQIQMSTKIINDSYEMLELNPSEPIIFESNNKYEQCTHNPNNQVILIVPRESHTRRELN
jgi:hypothetical protein